MLECMNNIGNSEIDHERIFYNLYLQKYLEEDRDIVPADVNDNEFLLDLMYMYKNSSIESKDFSKGMRDAFAFYVSNGIIKDVNINLDEVTDLRIYINVEKLRTFDVNNISKEKTNAKVLKKETKK